MKRKGFSFLLILLVLSCCFLSACSGKGQPNQTAESSVEETTPETGPKEAIALPDADYEGYVFRILMRDEVTHSKDFFVDEDSTNSVDQAVWARNDIVCSRYNIEMKCIWAVSPEASSERRNLMAGQDFYDLVAPHGRVASTYAIEGVCVNLYDMPYLNLDFSWWSQLANEAFTINDVLFFTTGDLSYVSSACAYALLCNKTAMELREMTLPYEQVKNNTWTWEVFSELVRNAGDDLNSDGQYDLKVDRFSYLTHHYGGAWQAFFSSNNRILSVDNTGALKMTGNTESAYNALNDFFTLTNSEKCFVGDVGNYWSMLQSGLFYFSDVTLLDISTFKDAQVEYAIVPYPKVDTTMEHYACNTAGGGSQFLVPITIQDWNSGGRERTSVILEALCQEGQRVIRPIFFDEIVSYQSMKTPENYEMLSYIIDGRLFDIGYYYMSMGSMCDFVTNLSKKGGVGEFTSLFDSYATAAKENLDRMIAAYK